MCQNLDFKEQLKIFVTRTTKVVNFDRTEAGLTAKWGRILPAVRWCYQNQSNCTVRCCTTLPRNFLNGRQSEYCLNSEVALANKVTSNPYYITLSTLQIESYLLHLPHCI